MDVLARVFGNAKARLQLVVKKVRCNFWLLTGQGSDCSFRCFLTLQIGKNIGPIQYSIITSNLELALDLDLELDSI